MKTDVLEKILERVKPNLRDFVKSELIRVRNDFYSLPIEKVKEIYESHSSVVFLYEYLEDFDPDLGVVNKPLQFDVQKVLLPEYTPCDDDFNLLELENNLIIYELIDAFCSPDISR